jgi:hypothetical protein
MLAEKEELGSNKRIFFFSVQHDSIISASYDLSRSCRSPFDAYKKSPDGSDVKIVIYFILYTKQPPYTLAGFDLTTRSPSTVPLELAVNRGHFFLKIFSKGFC